MIGYTPTPDFYNDYIAHSFVDDEETLAHYGVKGMRWGRRRETKEEARSRRRKEGARRKAKKAFAEEKSAISKFNRFMNGYYTTGKTDIVTNANWLGVPMGQQHARVVARVGKGKADYYHRTFNYEDPGSKDYTDGKKKRKK